MSDRVVVVDGVCGGQPVIRGTRISVLSVVNYMEIYGDTKRVLEALPHLETDDIEAAMDYHRSHTDEIERYRREEEESESWKLPNTYKRGTG